MLKESEKLFRDIDNIFVGLKDSSFDLSLIKAACAECVIIKLFAEFEICLKKNIIYDYLANNRPVALNLLNIDSHKMPRDLSTFISKFIQNDMNDPECIQKIQNLNTLRNKDIAHNAGISQRIAWEELPAYIQKANIFLNYLQQYLKDN